MLKFSIVTPNYNMGPYLEDTIKSVIKNLRAGDEYYIIDGGSTDNSVEIILKYEKFLTGWISEKDKGYAHALSKGFEMTNCQLQYWVNSGDLILLDALDRARIFFSQTGADLLFGDDLYIDDYGMVIQVTNGHVSELKEFMLNGGWTPLQDACFWKSSLYKKVGGIDITLKNAADYDLFLRMALQGRAQYSPVIYSAFRRHVGQKSIKNLDEYKKERAKCRERELVRAYAGRPFYKVFITAFYWFKVRWRVRVKARKSSTPKFRGQFAAEIKSQ